MSTSPRERPAAPRYIRLDGQWYISKEHMAEQLHIATESAFEDGVNAGIAGAETIDMEAAQ